VLWIKLLTAIKIGESKTPKIKERTIACKVSGLCLIQITKKRRKKEAEIDE
jgi:hypothetical protein